MEAYLLKANIPPQAYLQIARRFAKDTGYNPDLVELASGSSKSKLVITAPSGRKIYFGKQPYGDFILWTIREILGEVPEGTALAKRESYLARAKGIEEHRKTGRGDDYSPNRLAMAILWLG